MADLTQTAEKDTSPQLFWDFLAQEGQASPDGAIEFGLELATALERYPQGLGHLTPEMLRFSQGSIHISEAVSNSLLLLAPEVLDEGNRKDDIVDKQLADVWSIGVVLYTLLAGHSPFGGITKRQQVKAIITPGPTPDIRTVRPDVGEDFAGLLYHMLQRSTERRSNIPNAETVRRTLERIHTHQSIPYSIPEFPIVEAKAILKDAQERFHEGKGGLNENEYQFVRRLVDTGELTIGDEYASLWRYSQRRALARRFRARAFFACLLGLNVPVLSTVFDSVLSPSREFFILLTQATGILAFVAIVNSVSIGIVTYTSHLSKNARPPWWALPASLGTLAGALLVILYSTGVSTIYSNAMEAFVVGAVAGLAVGGVYTLSMPGERQDTILKQSRPSIVISGMVGVLYGIYFLAVQMPQIAGGALLYLVVTSIVGLPFTIAGLLLSFVVGVELGDRYVER